MSGQRGMTRWLHRPITGLAKAAHRLVAYRRAAHRLVAAGLAGSAIAALVGLAITIWADPAWAHGADAPDGSNYRSEVTGISPAQPGLTVRVVEGGARLELVNRTGRPIEVLGYDGEPYLEVRPDGVYENRNSPATYLNQTLAGGTPPPGADPRLPPRWQRISTEPVIRWHDRRTYWLGSTPPAAAVAEPDRVHRVRDWTVPLRDGLDPIEVHGTLDWLPPPNPLPWWGLSLLGAAAVAVLGWQRTGGTPGRWRLDHALLDATPDRPPVVPGGAPTDGGRRRTVTVTLAVLLAIGGAGALVLAAARAITTGDGGVAGIASTLLTTEFWPLSTGLAAIAAAGYALTRRPAADFALALAGVCVALFAGVNNAAVFARSVVPMPGPVLWTRLTVVLLIATGTGVAAAAILRLRAAARFAEVNAGDRDRPALA